MKKTFTTYFHKFTFSRQIGIMVTLGILILALISSIAGSWQGNKRMRDNLIEQGQQITENLARQSALALIYASADNANEAVNITMAFPGVVGVEIRNTQGETLLTRGEVNLAEFFEQPKHKAGLQASAMLSTENSRAWRFAAPVYSQPPAESPFGEEIKPEFLGNVSVVMSKDELARRANDIVITNLFTSFFFALLFLWLLRKLTRSVARPLEQLSDSMERARLGESHVRAVPGGPKDIAEMAYAFNSMMTELEEREADLRIAATAFEVEEGVFVTDDKSVIIQVNQAFTRLTGYSAEEAVGNTSAILKSGRQDAEFYRNMWATIQRDRNWKGEIWNKRKNGEIYPEWLSITAVVGKEGKVTNYVGAFVDITERKQASADLHQLAYYDPLSQLPNRRMLLDRLRHAVATGARNRTSGALLFIDLDNFKTLNDTKGHVIGDMLLVEVAKRLLANMRECDTVARFGGDEFVVLLEGLGEETAQAATQAQEVGEKVLQALCRPYLLDGNEFHSSSSIGITLFADYKQSLDELLKQADTAMYESKKSGRNTLRFFDPEMQAKLEARSELEVGLRQALLNQEFQLFYQIQVSHAGRVLGAEVLIRWIHPEKGLISPLQFIPLAEETGLILPIGQWVLETACAQIKTWEQDVSTRNLVLAVNVSAKQFCQPDFVTQVQAAVHNHAINPWKLKLELTESMLHENIEDTIATMNELKTIGIQFSLDDFGTGYSSLQYLKRLPLDQLKIDQSFVRNLTTDNADVVMVMTIVDLGMSFEVDVIAEGVETEEQLRMLHRYGCSNFQGYLFSKPVPLKEFEALVHQAKHTI
jgi:diguanylate cyclase (GGDEF)-like protein/PAS domain S-box-containing protein